jgi:hypothetical protein
MGKSQTQGWMLEAPRLHIPRADGASCTTEHKLESCDADRRKLRWFQAEPDHETTRDRVRAGTAPASS